MVTAYIATIIDICGGYYVGKSGGKHPEDIDPDLREGYKGQETPR